MLLLSFENNIIAMYNTHQLIIYDYRKSGRYSGQHTCASEAHSSTSWLDHVICNQDVYLKLLSVDILDNLHSHELLTTFRYHLSLTVFILI